MNKCLIACFALLMSTPSMAKLKDVINSQQSEYIRVTHVVANEELVRFELCHTKTTTDNATNDCMLLGGRPYLSGFTLDELEDQRHSEYFDLAFTALGNAAALMASGAAGGLGAFHIGTLMSKTSIDFAAGFVLSGIGIGGVVGVTVIDNFVDALNPFSQWRDTQVLSPEIIHDEVVHTTKDIKQLAWNLNKVLHKIDD